MPSFSYQCKTLLCTCFFHRLLKRMLQLQSSKWKDNDTYLCLFDPFSFSFFSAEQVTDVKKPQYMFFSSPISLGLEECNLASHAVHILLNVKTVFHFLKSTFIQFCNAKLRLWGKHAEWPMTDYFSKHLASSLLKVNCGDIVFWLSFKSVMSCEFFQTLGIHSTWFLLWNCPLGFLFPIKISLWILQTGQISIMLHHNLKYTEDDDHLSFFQNVWKFF